MFLEFYGLHDQPFGVSPDLDEFLARETNAGRSFVLVIDDAQNLDDSVLETVRLLSNFETPSRKLLQIILSGQPRLAAKLAAPGLTQLCQRISILCRLEPFSTAETARYIEHRCTLAGHQGESLFAKDALEMIAAESRGLPRNINNLCFNALSLGCALGRKKIDPAIVREVLSDLELGSIGPSSPPPCETAAASSIQPLSYQVTGSSGLVRGTRRVAAIVAICASLFLFFLAGIFKGRTLGRSAPRAIKGARLAPIPSITALAEAAVPGGATVTNGREPAGAAPDPHAAALAVVQPGQTLRQICLRHLGQFSPEIVGQICALNPQLNPDDIKAGEWIWLPMGAKGSGLGVARGDKR